ncbi:MAG: ABC transporter substrate-binding protein [SAR202 cluster bacterium]|nr:ABC transporter substrate-binding protein [SAR202 cluster bacterium]
MFKVELNYFSRFFLLIFTVILILNCSTSSNLEQKFDSSSGSSSISENIPIKKDLGLKVSDGLNSATPIPLATPLPAAPALTPSPPVPPQPSMRKNYSSSKPEIVPVPRALNTKVKPIKTPETIETPISLDSDQNFYLAVRSPADHVRPWKEGADQRIWMTSAFMPIFRFDSDNNVQPSVALDYVVSENQLEYTIFIDPKAIFTDGSKLNASHIKENLEFGSIPQQQVSWGALTSITRLIFGCEDLINGLSDECIGLEVVDDHTLRIKLNQIFPTFPKELSKWLTGIQKIENVKQNPEWEKNPIGVGPFVVSWDRESGEVNLTRTSNHWIDYSGTVSGVKVLPVQDSEKQLDLYSKSKLDLIIAGPSIQPSVHNMGSKYLTELHRIPYEGIFYYAFDVTKSPFDDLDFRRAIVSAVDVGQINRSVFGGKEKTSFGWLTPETICFNRDFQHPIPYDPNEAKKYFSSSKYNTGDKLDIPTLRISQQYDRKDWVVWTQGFKAMVEFNLEVPVEILLEDEIYRDLINFGRYSQTITDADPNSILWKLSHPDSDVLNSQFGFNDNNLKELIENAGKIQVNSSGTGLKDADYGREDRCKAFREIEMYLLRNAYGIPIINVNHHFLVKPWISGFKTSVNYDISSLPSIKILQRIDVSE